MVKIGRHEDDQHDVYSAPVANNATSTFAKQAINGNMTDPENRDAALEMAGLTIQVEQFITVFIQTTTLVVMRAERDGKVSPESGYHDYRQLIIYVEALHRLIYDQDVGPKLITYFEDQMPNNVMRMDPDIMRNYIVYFRNFFDKFKKACSYSEQKTIAKTLKKVQYDLESDFGYEAHLTR